MDKVTGEQLRAARALGRFTQAELAQASGVSLETVKRLEGIHGPVNASRRTKAALAGALESRGIVLDSAGGVGHVRALGGTVGEGANNGPEMQRLIYRSVMCGRAGQNPSPVLADILESSLRRNPSAGLTGALLAGSGRFLQVLEGPGEAVAQLFERIMQDSRHDNVVVIEHRPIRRRQFADWSMCCGQLLAGGPAVAAEPALRNGLNPETLSPAAALGLLCVVRDLQDDQASTN
jgi:transcriptional regulator with XRE-family HTH domain